MIVAVLGLGSIGLRHATNLLTLGQTVIGFDPDSVRQGILVERGGQLVQNRSEALRQAEAVIIASPNSWHLKDLSEALAAGCHIFIEKPLAHKLDGIEQILRLADESKRVVFAGLNLRLNPVIIQAKRFLDEGLIGKAVWARFIFSDYLPSWRPQQDYRLGYTSDPQTGGILFDAIHEFDQAYYLLGKAKTVGVAALNTGQLDMRSEDCADVILRHSDGVQSSLHLDYVGRPRMRRSEICGTLGRMELELDRRYLRVLSTDSEVLFEDRYGGSYAEDYVEEMRCFLDCIRGVRSPPCDGWEALEVLALVLAARDMAGLS